MALPPRSEVFGLVATTAVTALWVYATAQWALAEVFEAPGKTAQVWPFVLAGVATAVLVWGMRSNRMKKREAK
jgi:hypothetical protein